MIAFETIRARAAQTWLSLTHISRICAMSVGENHASETLLEQMEQGS